MARGRWENARSIGDRRPAIVWRLSRRWPGLPGRLGRLDGSGLRRRWANGPLWRARWPLDPGPVRSTNPLTGRGCGRLGCRTGPGRRRRDGGPVALWLPWRRRPARGGPGRRLSRHRHKRGRAGGCALRDDLTILAAIADDRLDGLAVDRCGDDAPGRMVDQLVLERALVIRLGAEFVLQHHGFARTVRRPDDVEPARRDRRDGDLRSRPRGPARHQGANPGRGDNRGETNQTTFLRVLPSTCDG
ncbi:hypothetical protein SAMN05192568_1015102 [Methylobacterium pseudosasicola]|uniref:Uncharacterized protein n=1 Tax=Methylobacterium pseudosasicola TaxID=582667 RepID=A0A1I4M4R7_9HYPH|nr:hypothetical protein SAMN05192568_1015102 [Methylobacterium pseudosasicola]